MDVRGRKLDKNENKAQQAQKPNSFLSGNLLGGRAASQFEVDLILRRGDVAIEIKSTTFAKDRHFKGLRAFKEEHKSKYILVSQDLNPRKTDDGILILPWKVFLDRLWANEIIR
jgi:hypothetical protein